MSKQNAIRAEGRSEEEVQRSAAVVRAQASIPKARSDPRAEGEKNGDAWKIVHIP